VPYDGDAWCDSFIERLPERPFRLRNEAHAGAPL
jgi:hypothetical protein